MCTNLMCITKVCKYFTASGGWPIAAVALCFQSVHPCVCVCACICMCVHTGMMVKALTDWLAV